MFPPQLPSVFIRWLTDPGDVIYDPFSGRGTVALQALLHGRVAYATDANPLAVALSSAKVRIPSEREAYRRIDELEALCGAPAVDEVPDDISMLYSPHTLAQLVYLREALRAGHRVDDFIRATVLGLLHGNHSAKGATRGLSLSMPNTFAMAPGYIRAYVAANNLTAPTVDTFQMLRRRIAQLDLPAQPLCNGRAWLHDATAPTPRTMRRAPAKLIFTSPPYLEVIKYAKYNWVRLWFLGHEPAAVDSKLMASASLERYREFMTAVLLRAEPALREDGYLCLVIGDVRRRRTNEVMNLAQDVWDSVASPLGWHLHGVVSDRVPSAHKVSRIWANNRGRATKTDRILILSRRPSDLPALTRMTWNKPAFAE
jgi:DNA modification methylase